MYDVVIGGNGVRDEIEAVSMLLHLAGISRDDHFIRPKAARVFLLAR